MDSSLKSKLLRREWDHHCAVWNPRDRFALPYTSYCCCCTWLHILGYCHVPRSQGPGSILPDGLLLRSEWPLYPIASVSWIIAVPCFPDQNLQSHSGKFGRADCCADISAMTHEIWKSKEIWHYQRAIITLTLKTENLQIARKRIQKNKFFFSFLFCCRTRVWIQGLALARQVLYHLSHIPQPSKQQS
jgi:hypothetical protein